MTLSAGRDLTLSGAQVSIGTSGTGDGLLLAGRTLAVTSVTNESKSDHHSDMAAKNYAKAIHNDQAVVGSNVGASGALTLAAGLPETGSLNLTASNLTSGGALGLSATGDINILSASESHLSDTAHKSSSSGFLKKSNIAASQITVYERSLFFLSIVIKVANSASSVH
jgi:filamentous hemagglutinin